MTTGWVHDPSFAPSNSTVQRSLNASNTTEEPDALLPSSASPAARDPTTIWFNVTFSSRAQLQVTFLTSYTNIGAAELTIHHTGALGKFDNSTALVGYLLNAKLNDAVSIPKMVVIVQPAQARNARVRSQSLVLPAAVGAGDYVVALRAVTPQAGESHKFKLLGIASC
jgi:hypothetical protein